MNEIVHDQFASFKNDAAGLAALTKFLVTDQVRRCDCLKCELKRKLLAVPRSVADADTLVATLLQIDQAFNSRGKTQQMSHDQALLINHDAESITTEIPF
jgi:hypothetical protein